MMLEVQEPPRPPQYRQMNHLCKVCGEPAAGFHFGAFTCEGCKSFFGRAYNNLAQIHDCKNGGQCVINKQNRTSCKACRLRKCLMVGMSKGGSRYGRRSNWFKIHCILQEQANYVSKDAENNGGNYQLDPVTNNLPVHHALPLTLPMNLETTNGKHEFSKTYSSEPDSDPRKTSTPKDSVSEENDVSNQHNQFIGLHPGLSLLHASQLYSRLYPQLISTTQPSPMMAPVPASSNSLTAPREIPPVYSHPFAAAAAAAAGLFNISRTTLPSPKLPLQLPLFSLQDQTLQSLPMNRKRCADSPIENLLCPQPWEASPAPEQDTPIDLSIKRPRLIATTELLKPTTPPNSQEYIVEPSTTFPVDLSLTV
ncbi:unnamed protein product [Meganyctiphanes norvegica]|uniref:Nuclear receptor domain-containing protein n=1 Tax=Meganyctiphanes norvegica TaxID=48144 RepID=A0AAV2SKD7_MEGNR